MGLGSLELWIHCLVTVKPGRMVCENAHPRCRGMSEDPARLCADHSGGRKLNFSIL
jgi:hypothetical protein